MTLEHILLILLVLCVFSGGGITMGGNNLAGGLRQVLMIVLWFCGIALGLAAAIWILRHFGVHI